jgi:hypothetical protein
VLGLSLQFFFLLISEWGAPTNSLKERKKERKSEPFDWPITNILGTWGHSPNIKT